MDTRVEAGLAGDLDNTVRVERGGHLGGGDDQQVRREAHEVKDLGVDPRPGIDDQGVGPGGKLRGDPV